MMEANMNRSVMKTVFAAGLALATVGATMAATTGSAEARWRHGRGWGVGAGIVGGLAAGALIAGAARPAYGYGYPAYGYPVYGEPAYEYAPSCHLERRQVWIDDYRWTYRRVRVCY
jgi:hypothetical protein